MAQKHTTNRRGQVGPWATFGIVVVISLLGFIVLAMVLDAFKTTALACPSGTTFNVTANNCYSGVNDSVKSPLTTAGNVTDNGRIFLANTSRELGTAGTILGVSLLLVIIGGIAFFGYRKFGGSR